MQYNIAFSLIIVCTIRSSFGDYYIYPEIRAYPQSILYTPSLSVQRLRTLQQKKEAQAKTSRRDIASLVERGKIETAKIKTEARKSTFSRAECACQLTIVQLSSRTCT
jgi:hypothetical protein